VTTNEGTRSGVSHFFLNLLRIGAGLLFMQHGAQKLFQVMGFERSLEPLSQLWVAGVLELWGGLLIVLGLFTRPVAVVLALEMVVAYVQAHMPRGGAPVENQGELALLYMLIWAFLAANGPGGLSLDGLIAARRRGSAAS
jgi:putative oxidoreductase